MHIGFIGAGKVATAFGRYLYHKGLPISGYHDRHLEKMSHAGNTTHSQAFANMVDVAAQSDMILITTRDDQIAGVCHHLCEQGCIKPRHLVGHMSGAHSSIILTEAQKQGATTFSLHPLQAFADAEKAFTDLPETYFSLEGQKNELGAITDLLSKIGNPFFTISPEHKSLYHLSACMLSNYLVTLMESGLAALEQAGIDPQLGYRAMRPLIDGSLDNIEQLGPAHALTGPIARGDAGTIAQHLASLEAMDLDGIRSIYTFMGLKTLELATREILKIQDKADAVQQILEAH